MTEKWRIRISTWLECDRVCASYAWKSFEYIENLNDIPISPCAIRSNLVCSGGQNNHSSSACVCLVLAAEISRAHSTLAGNIFNGSADVSLMNLTKRKLYLYSQKLWNGESRQRTENHLNVGSFVWCGNCVSNISECSYYKFNYNFNGFSFVVDQSPMQMYCDLWACHCFTSYRCHQFHDFWSWRLSFALTRYLDSALVLVISEHANMILVILYTNQIFE